MVRIGVLVSGGGTNLQAIMDSIKSGYIENAKIVVVISNKKNAFALQRAESAGIPTAFISKKGLSQNEFDIKLTNKLKEFKVDLVLLAGFMSILGTTFIARYTNAIMNIHPALIPCFSGKGYYGLNVHKAVLDSGVKITGATVHFVTNEVDGGPIILQKAVNVLDDDTPEKLQRRVMEEAEWIIYPKAVKLFAENKLIIKNKKVIIKNGN